jgi:hypothetical protein
MIAQYDVFMKEPAGHVMWQGSAETMEKAQEMIKKLVEKSPHSEYIIFNLRTGNRVTVQSHDHVERKDADARASGSARA